MGTCGVSTHLWVYGYVWGQYTPVGSVHTCGFMGSGVALQVHITMDDPCSTRPWRKHSCRVRHSTHTLTHTHTHRQQHTHTHTHTHVRRHTHTHTGAHTHTCAHTHAHTHTHTGAQTHTCAQTHAHT